MILSVDLATKQSAHMVRTRSGEVLRQGDSRSKSAFGYLREVARDAAEFEVEIVGIEDIPYGISSQAQTKAPARLQGVAMVLLHHFLERMVFINPSTWQYTFEGVARAPKGMKGAEAEKYRYDSARAHALRLGYEPPDLVGQFTQEKLLHEGEKARILKKDTNPLLKTETDYIDAFLMGEWIASFPTFEELCASKGVQLPLI